MNKKDYSYNFGDEYCPECHKIVKVQEIYHFDYSQWVCNECGYVIDVEYDDYYCDDDEFWGGW